MRICFLRSLNILLNSSGWKEDPCGLLDHQAGAHSHPGHVHGQVQMNTADKIKKSGLKLVRIPDHIKKNSLKLFRIPEMTDAQCGALLLRAEDAHQVLMGGVGALPSGGGARQGGYQSAFII